jgi:hypothetical protein
VALAALAALVLPPAVVMIRGATAATVPAAPLTADFGDTEASAQARRLAGWIARSRDNAGAQFIIIDKKRTEILIFDPNARLVAASPVLIGAAVGDDSAPGVGQRPWRRSASTSAPPRPAASWRRPAATCAART